MKKHFSLGSNYFFISLILLFLLFLIGCSPEIGYGIMEIHSIPEGAKIYLDGSDTGKVTPANLDSIESGNHVLQLSLYLYNNWETLITVNPGEILNINAIMEEATIQTLEITSCIDTMVNKNNPNSNFCANSVLSVGTNTRSFLKFDLGSVQEGIILKEATLLLRLKQYQRDTEGATIVSVFKILEDWEESTTTWNNQPGYSSPFLDSTIPYSVFDNKFIITELVKNWLNGINKNYGILLNDSPESTAEYTAEYYSSEYTDDVSKCPRIHIDYYIP